MLMRKAYDKIFKGKIGVNKEMTFRGLVKTVHKMIARKIVFDNSDIRDVVFVASMGRSGSTFLMNIINYDNRYRVLFEPFRYDVVNEAKDFVYPFYLQPDNTNSKYFLAAKKIILGKVKSKWVNVENRKIFPKARLIKDIRANFFLKWLQNNFPEMKIILLIRHPCAVINSWISNGFGDGKLGRERLLSNQDFVSDVDDMLIKEYAKVKTAFERLVFFWCFSYYIPFRQFNYDDIHVVFYENIILNPKEEVKKIFNFLGYKHYLESDILNRLSDPSSTTRKDKSFFLNKHLRIDQWKDNCLKEQVDRAYEIMKLFGLEELYSPDDSTPNEEILEELFGLNMK